ncbi:MAG: Ni/Fe-hydrogenase cytochrome b subunit [Rhodocyclaceae bacterium]|jgi:Ni/Fe-hydrogenase subunit HybB-like protein|nr:Ni/Fe-hydrogenase cytochrome b subunit [Rhodocyclaceae bacterium]MBK6553854.1 Ni/Fe-hydrogenase cytochrome b subunit [Rhodocyclaceae bacterium]MBK9310868.1 Ni/Fe-hydrogenase cytochrome b subunit [Rhodocyclaceae bacterium]MBK9954062.1 Ni/Fe-hydrogenase cytochrome b subunit [Rhodocyclaceae bacterium]
MSEYVELKRPLFTPFFMALALLVGLAVVFLAVRFVNGMGSVANLNGGYSWGIWVVYDIVVGTALACGGYALAVTVYVFNKGKYHPLIRPALLTSLLGYGFAAFGAFVDMGRWWQFYNLFLPWQMNFHSVMLEVGLCVSAYVMVLSIEFLPTILQRFRAQALAQRIESVLSRALFFVIALGILLPTMHQSSLGSFLIAMGWKVHPLWQTLHFQPLLAVLSAFTMGFAIVVLESSLAAAAFRRAPETPLLAGLGRIIVGLIVAFLVIRFAAILWQGKLGRIFAFDLGSLMFLIETALFAYPLAVLISPRGRRNAKKLLYAAASMVLAGALYRFDAFLITFDPGPGYSYFPAFPESMVTVGTVAAEIMAYLYFVKKFPVLPREEHAAA